MDFNDVMYGWTPASAQGQFGATAGKIEVGPFPDTKGWSHKYMRRSGAAFTRAREWDEARQALMLLADFHTMVMRDGLSPQAVHGELMKIRQYRRNISTELAGSEAARGVRVQSLLGLQTSARS